MIADGLTIARRYHIAGSPLGIARKRNFRGNHPTDLADADVRPPSLQTGRRCRLTRE